MGLTQSKKRFNIDKVFTQSEFKNIIENEKIEFHEQMLKKNKWAKVYICEKETEADRNDPVYRENCEIDEICNDYKNRYYVAQLKTIQTTYPDRVAQMAMIQHTYHQFWSYAIDIYEYHIHDASHKKLLLKNYYISNSSHRKENHMADDFEDILNKIKSLNADDIEEAYIRSLKNKTM